MRDVTIEALSTTYRIALPHGDTDYIQKMLLASRRPYEEDMLRDMASRLSESSLVVDVGANVGNHTLYLAAHGARVIAYEPNIGLADAIRSSVDLNDFGQLVEVRCAGVGAQRGQGGFEKEIPANLGAQKLRDGQGDLPIVALDDEDFQSPVSLLKIDVEGGEFAALEGARALIARDRPGIYVECGTESEFNRVSHWMEQANYLVWDTWNGTPTHLFLPQESLSLDRKIARLNTMLTKTQIYGSQRRMVSILKLLYRWDKIWSKGGRQ